MFSAIVFITLGLAPHNYSIGHDAFLFQIYLFSVLSIKSVLNIVTNRRKIKTNGNNTKNKHTRNI
uniref:Uncharacterized protein n=1 Tax=Myoviridae sp. ctoNH1 TaxID=2826695 RepID=A0A8S5QS03_9CAUD|nr:MAG TPA: hypothetical protein [Myoviridae sp. ctoNH1]